jgi:hypothetical protein
MIKKYCDSFAPPPPPPPLVFATVQKFGLCNSRTLHTCVHQCPCFFSFSYGFVKVKQDGVFRGAT